METTVVTAKGQIVIPSRIRRRYGIKKGTRVCLIERNGEIILKPINRKYMRRWQVFWGRKESY